MKIASFILISATASLFGGQAAFKIKGKTTNVDDLVKQDPGAFYKIEDEKHQIIERAAVDAYLKAYWEAEASSKKKSVEAVQNDFKEANSKVSASELNAAVKEFKDNPQLKDFTAEEKKQKIEAFLSNQKYRSALQAIVENARASKQLEVVYPAPKEPRYNVKAKDSDIWRYGPSEDDTKSLCKGECQITIVEYSEFECPFCSRVLPTAKSILSEYKGKVRWAVRDFPLDFHERARPAAIAAHCAGKQGKFWHMYNKLFENQKALSDDNFKDYASKIKGLNADEWKKCVASPGPIVSLINENMASGSQYGVTGTPAFFINGRRLSGALPYEEFKKVIEDELKSAKKS